MKTISFVIPIYNEEKRIHKTLKALNRGFSFDAMKLKKVIFVDDGSTDNTVREIIEQKLKIEKKLRAKIKIISYTKNRGKGYAVKKGMLASKSDYTLIFDADMSTPLTEFKKMLPYLYEKKDIVISTRKNGHSTIIKHQPFYRELLGRFFTLFSNIILNTWVTDFTCGFKVFSKRAKDEILRYAFIDSWGYDAEFLFLANHLGFAIEEVSIKWTNDNRTKVNLIRDIPQSLFDLIRIRWYYFLRLINKLPAGFSSKLTKSYSYN